MPVLFRTRRVLSLIKATQRDLSLAAFVGERFQWSGPTPRSFYDKSVEEYARLEAPLIPLRAFIHRNCLCLQPGAAGAAARLEYADELRHHLAVRFARNLRSFQNLPYIVGIHPVINHLYNQYFSSFQLIRHSDRPTDAETELAFRDLLRTLSCRHENVISMLSVAVYEARPGAYRSLMSRSRAPRRAAPALCCFAHCV
eukprot:TRINITY_DN8491_c0_g1_i2.p1 TRINITY_DN8491_c0_g1~~TRINITY_DN8491_c0_g1_i2.p1  ORF type:complete len:199 (+),score=4.96 TRINITY_DN8491_c0_g1_i2:106-702(+)